MANEILSLEMRCQIITEDYNDMLDDPTADPTASYYLDIQFWQFTPYDFDPEDRSFTAHFRAITKEIESAPLIECLTSPIKYIRDYRFAFEERKKELENV